MAHIDLTLHWLAIPLDDGQQWVHAAGFPEINRITATRKGGERALAKRIDARLSRENIDHVHCRIWPTPSLTTIPVEIKAPARSAEWRRPVTIEVQVLYAQHGAQWLAFAPALGMSLAAESEEKLRETVVQQAHVRLGKLERARLRELAQVDRFRGATLTSSSEPFELPSAKARAARREQIDTSVLAEVADPFPSLRAIALDATVLRLAEALSGDMAHSVLLVGPPGCGKTSAVAELARRHPALGLKQTDGARLIAGQSGYGQWQQRLRELVRELAKAKSILHLGQLTELMEVGRCRAGEQSMAGFLRGDIARGTLRAIAECTQEQLAAIERDEPGLIAAFQTVTMQAPDVATTREILQAEARALHIDMDAAQIGWIERLHRRYAGYSARPARAIEFLRDLGQSGVQSSLPSITQAFSQQTGLPAWLLDESQRFDRDGAERFFSTRVLGQTAAIKTVLARVAEIKADLHRGGRPLGSFLLIGPTGTGKTELAKTLAAFLFGSGDRLTRFDLSQATDPLSVQRLIGSSAYGAPEGLLTARVREQPFCVLLLDEFEKAHPSFFDLLLQMLGDGRLTDGSGRVADLSNAVVLLTSNLGANDAQRAAMGFAARQSGGEYEAAVKRFVRPELYNRFDAIVPFAPLDRTQCRAIAAREVQRALARDGLRQRGIEPQLPADTIERLADVGFDAAFGARALKRHIERELVVPLSESLAANPLASQLILVDRRIRASTTTRPASSGAAVANAARDLRQRCARIQNCSELQALIDEAEMLKLAAKRLSRRHLKPLPTAVARLKLLSELQTDAQALLNAACLHEDAALAGLWDREVGPSPAPNQLTQELLALKRRILAAAYRDPHRIELLLVADVHGWLCELLAAYRSLKVKLRVAQIVERHGTELRVRALDEVPYKATVLDQPPPVVIGLTFVVEGDLCAALFSGEVGIHLWRPAREVGGPRLAMLRATSATEEIDLTQLRDVTECGLPRVREFDHDKAEVREGKWRRLWDTMAPRYTVAERMRDRLQLAIDRIGASEAAP